jgi:glycosyltransferase involved in cell wall biosynthesis
MKLLMITRKVDKDDDRAGFIYAWIKKISPKVEKLTVICLEKGNLSGLRGITIYSLGKEEYLAYPHFIRRLITLYRFYKYIWHLRKEYDSVFVHMHSIYVILAGWLWRLWDKKIGLWCAHVQVNTLAKIASYLVDYIFSPSKESFNFPTRKLKKVGHGVDTQIFKPLDYPRDKKDKWQIISLGRISLVKDYDTLIEAIKILVNQYQFDNFEVKIIGQPARQEDFKYLKRLKEKIKKYHLEKYFHWLGGIPNKEAVKFYQSADIFVSMQAGGGFGKSVLEAMACGLVCVLCTPVYNKILGDYQKETIFEEKNPQSMAEKLNNTFNWPSEKYEHYRALARDYVVKNHNLDNLIDKIISFYE